MGTVGDQVLERINALEARLDQYERTGAAGGIGVPADGIQGLQNELGQLKTRMDEINASPFAQPSNRTPQNPKDWMPDTLSQNFRDRWRNWSYKTRD